MLLIDRLEQAAPLDPVVSAGQRVVRLIRPDKVRDALHGVWLGHPLHPVLAQATVGAWVSASVLDFAGGREDDARLLTAVACDEVRQHVRMSALGVVVDERDHRVTLRRRGVGCRA